MPRRLVPLFLVAAGLAGSIFLITVIAPWLLWTQPNLVSEQPIFFDHSIHVQTAGLDCAFCHRTATVAETAGFPDVEQCMFCHNAIGQGVLEIEKLRAAWVLQEPIDWMRITRLPDHTRFVHEPHLRPQTGFNCETCHGDVGQMGQVVQVRALNMGDCVSCHRTSFGGLDIELERRADARGQYGAPTECATCHY